MKYLNKKIENSLKVIVTIFAIFLSCMAYANESQHDELKGRAESGDAIAQYELGNAFASGLQAVGQNDNDALYWYEKSAMQGNADAQFALAIMYKKTNKGDKSIEWYEKAATQGHIQSQYVLAEIYYDGVSVEQDLKKSIYWYKKAADQGYSLAQITLGCLYYFGQLDDENEDQDDPNWSDKQGIYWYKKAAELGEPYAQLSLGIIEANQANYKQSLFWLDKACQNGLIDGCDLHKEIKNGSIKKRAD